MAKVAEAGAGKASFGANNICNFKGALGGGYSFFLSSRQSLMTLSQADVDRLEAAVVRGELTVEYDGRRVTYRSMGELLQALAYVKGELQSQAGTAEQNRMSYVQFDRGLRD